MVKEGRNFYDLKTAIERALTSRSTFIRAVERLKIKAYKFPGDKKYYYAEEDIDAIKDSIHSPHDKKVQLIQKPQEPETPKTKAA
jgi:hypothetical protein